MKWTCPDRMAGHLILYVSGRKKGVHVQEKELVDFFQVIIVIKV